MSGKGQMWSTNDTATAVFLVYNGMTIRDYRWEGTRCFFDFDECDELHTLLRSLNTGMATVEPMAYNRMFGQVKAEMFASRDGG